MIKHQNREEWLNAAIAEFKPLFESVGAGMPDKLRVTCGFPSTFKRTGNVAEFFRPESSADGTWEILISPTIATPNEVCIALWGVLGEMCKAPQPWEGMDNIVQSLGDYPHAALAMTVRKTQSTRMLKACCPGCGMIIRLTAKWAATLPVCSVDGQDFVIDGVTA